MLRSAPLVLLLAAGSASATEYTSDTQDLTYQGVGTAVDSKFVIPIGVSLDFIIAEVWVGVTITLHGAAQFGLYVEGTSDLSWDDDDQAPGLIYQEITPLAGSGIAGLDADAGLNVSFDLRDGNSSGRSYISFTLFSQNIRFALTGDPFTPWLLPGSTPASQTLTTRSKDLAFELPLYISIPIAGVVNVSFGPKIVGYPQTTAVFGGKALATAHDNDIVTGGEIYLYEQVPELQLLSAYQAYVNTVIAYVFDITLDFHIDLLGIVNFNYSIPLWGQAFPLFSDSVDLIFPSKIYNHPVPMITPAVQTINFGKVEVGDSKDFTLPVNNDGYLDLSGFAELTSDPAFGVAAPQFFATAGGQAPVVVSFSPKRTGDFNGVLTLRSSDPYRETLDIPIQGKAVKASPNNSGPGGDNDDFIPGGSDIYETCGCDSQSGNTAGWTVLGLAAVGLLRRRRHQA